MEQFFIELEYIKNHFPEFILSLIPKVLIGLIILQIVLGLVKFTIRNSETGRTEQIKAGISTLSVILWVIMIILLGVELYYYIMHVRLHEIAVYMR